MSQIIETITTKKKPPKHIADFDQKARKEFEKEKRKLRKRNKKYHNFY